MGSTYSSSGKTDPLRILLFTPPKGLARGSVSKPRYGIQSLGILHVATALKAWSDFPCRIKVVDGYTFGLGRGEVIEEIRSYRPGVVGVSAATVRVYDAQAVCAAAKEVSPGILTVLGGPHASSVPEDAARLPAVDLAVVGEGEEAFLAICRAVYEGRDPRDVPGTAFLKEDDVVINPPNPLIEDLDSIPDPDIGFLPPLKHYNPLPVWGKSGDFSTMVTSRGCPYGCSYCSVFRVQGGKYRYQTAASVYRYLGVLYRDWGVRNVIFKEGTFTRNRERVVELCNLMTAGDMRISWTCNARVNELDPELLSLMKEAGCTCIQMGVEQGNAELLWKYKKLKKDQVAKVLGQVREAGIDAHGCFMLGMPEEDLSTIRETIEFAKSLPLNTAFFNVFTPRPGTKIFEECREKGQIPESRWDRLDDKRSTWNHPRLTARELERSKARAYRSFYLRPVIIADRLKHIRSWRDFVNHLKGTVFFFIK